MLSNFNVSQKTEDANKQFAMIRSYLIQLKDEIEGELNNIGYNNLDSDLRARFEKLSTLITEGSNMTNMVAENLQAKYITAESIDAKYATIQSLNAQSARIDTLDSTTVKTDYLTANYLTANQISSTYVATQTLEANYLTAQQIQTNYLTASQIQANYLSASQIQANYATLTELHTNYATISELHTDYLNTTQLDGKYATLSSLSFKADKGNLVGQINASSEGIQISASKLELNGLVSFNNLTDGTTQISGSNIKTGTISASRISSDIMRTSDFTAASIQGKFMSPESGYMTFGTVRCANFYEYDGQTGTYNQFRHRFVKDVNGNTVTVFGI